MIWFLVLQVHQFFNIIELTTHSMEKVPAFLIFNNQNKTKLLLTESNQKKKD